MLLYLGFIMTFDEWFKENVSDVADIPPKMINPELLMVICRTWAECAWNYQQKIIDKLNEVRTNQMAVIEGLLKANLDQKKSIDIFKNMTNEIQESISGLVDNLEKNNLESTVNIQGDLND